MAITGDQSFLKQINRIAMIRLVRAQTGLSRADIAKQTGLTKSTVSLLVQELIDEGWLCEETVQATGLVGRRPTPLALGTERLALLGVDVGCDFLNVLISTLKGEILYREMRPFTNTAIDARLDALMPMLKSALKLHPAYRVLGIGFGIHGILSADARQLIHAPNLGWTHLDIHALIAQKLSAARINLPFYPMNESNAGALAESVFAQNPAHHSLVYLSMGVGLGAGIVLKGRLYCGHDGYAGELGHTIMQIDGPQCGCGRRGCAETLISQSGLSRLLEEKEILTIAELQRRLQTGDIQTQEAVNTAGRMLGVLLQNIANSINPEEIVLGGPLVDLGDALVGPAMSTFSASQGRFDTRATIIRISQAGLDACALGAAARVFEEMLQPGSAG
jgi:predicted NBD/HSP70 family sugar kinase